MNAHEPDERMEDAREDAAAKRHACASVAAAADHPGIRVRREPRELRERSRKVNVAHQHPVARRLQRAAPYGRSLAAVLRLLKCPDRESGHLARTGNI